MFWDFLKKKPVAGGPSKAQGEKLPRPQSLPEAVGRELVVGLDKDPDWVWRLKCVMRRTEQEKSNFDIRIFDEAEAAKNGVRVQDYTSLDDYPELILFDGWFDKKSRETHIQEKGKPEPVREPTERPVRTQS
jgi:hypothetical protein